MSGGSWNYLYSQEVDELVRYESIRLLEEMADYLNSIWQSKHWKCVYRINRTLKVMDMTMMGRSYLTSGYAPAAKPDTR